MVVSRHPHRWLLQLGIGDMVRRANGLYTDCDMDHRRLNGLMCVRSSRIKWAVVCFNWVITVSSSRRTLMPRTMILLLICLMSCNERFNLSGVLVLHSIWIDRLGVFEPNDVDALLLLLPLLLPLLWSTSSSSSSSTSIIDIPYNLSFSNASFELYFELSICTCKMLACKLFFNWSQCLRALFNLDICSECSMWLVVPIVAVYGGNMHVILKK